MEYKLFIEGLKYQHYCDDNGQIYHKLSNGHKVYAAESIEHRSYESAMKGKPMKYLSVSVPYVTGSIAQLDVAEEVARAMFGVPQSQPGYGRTVSNNISDTSRKNIQFVAADEDGDIMFVVDHKRSYKAARLGKDKRVFETKVEDSVRRTMYIGKWGRLEYIEAEQDSLGERDRSLIAECLYVLIEDRGFTPSEALYTLMLDDEVKALELYLEGRDSVRKTSDETIAKVNQEREEKYVPTKLIKTNACFKHQPVYLDHKTGKSYIKGNGGPEAL